MEISIGFKAETGIPFLATGEANAAVKVSAPGCACKTHAGHG
jgi:hypothetical protein